MKVHAIYARAENGAFGNKGRMPWPKLDSDMVRFKELTMGHSVIMGSNTWRSLPNSVKPLPGRTNIVVSRADWGDQGFKQANDPMHALEIASRYSEQAFVIGGPNIINFLWPYYTGAYVTQVEGDYVADVFMESPIDSFILAKQTAVIGKMCYTMQEWMNPYAPTETQLDLILCDYRATSNASQVRSEQAMTLPTGFKEIDKKMGGIKAGDLCVWGAGGKK